MPVLSDAPVCTLLTAVASVKWHWSSADSCLQKHSVREAFKIGGQLRMLVSSSPMAGMWCGSPCMVVLVLLTAAEAVAGV